MKKFWAILSTLCIVINSASAEFTTPARAAFLIDAGSGAVLVNKAGDELMPPSSMLKMMTLALTFDAIKDGRIGLDDKLPVSENANYKNPTWRTASKICLETGQTVALRDLIMGIIVMSGGDASVVVAEKLAGTESAFANAMTRRAREIGMHESTFGNATGLPHPNNLMTARELAILAEYLITRHADLYPMFATRRWEFGNYANDWCREWGRTKAMNYNKLLFIMPGADGLKTGSTTEGGYGLTASARRGDRRLIGVINGLKARDHDHLAREMKRLLDHGFDTTANKIFFQPGTEIVRVPLWYGRKSHVAATVAKPFAVTVSRPGHAGASAKADGADTKGIRILARYSEPAIATVRAGDKLGEIIAEKDGKVIARGDLVAAEKVGRTRFIGRIWQNIKIIFTGKI